MLVFRRRESRAESRVMQIIEMHEHIDGEACKEQRSGYIGERSGNHLQWSTIYLRGREFHLADVRE